MKKEKGRGIKKEKERLKREERNDSQKADGQNGKGFLKLVMKKME